MKAKVLSCFVIVQIIVAGSAAAQDFCSDILKHGIKDEFSVISNSRSQREVADVYCRNSSSFEQNDRTGGFSFGYGDILGSTTKDTKVRHKQFTDALCTDSSSNTNSTNNFSLAAKIANDAVVAAWSECISSSNVSGFIQFARPSRTVAGAFNYTIEFKPTNATTTGTISVVLDNATCTGPSLTDLTVQAGAPVNLLCSRVIPGGVRLAPTAKADGQSLSIVEMDLPEIPDVSGNWVMEGIYQGKLFERYNVNISQSGSYVSGTAVGNWDKDRDDVLEEPTRFDIYGVLDGSTIIGKFLVPESIRTTNRSGNIMWNIDTSGNEIIGTIWTGNPLERPWSGSKN